MTRSRMMLAALAVLALSGATLAFAGVSEEVPTRLTMANRPPAFHGKVRTDVPDCESDRRVKVFYVANPKRGFGGGELVGRTNSDFDGRWFAEVSPLIDGGYYAKVKQHIVNVNGVLVRCLPDFARGVVVGG